MYPPGWLALADSCATPRHSTHPSPKPTLFTAASPPRRPVRPQRQTCPTVPIADAFPSHIAHLPSTSLSLLNTNSHPYPPKYLEPGIGTYHDRNRTRHLLFFHRQQPSPTGLAQTTLVRFDGTLDDDTLLTLLCRPWLPTQVSPRGTPLVTMITTHPGGIQQYVEPALRPPPSVRLDLLTTPIRRRATLFVGRFLASSSPSFCSGPSAGISTPDTA